MKIKTLSDALALVPEYWPLVPGVDKWRDGDKYKTEINGGGSMVWQIKNVMECPTWCIERG